jgi:hypothetical protein
MTAWLPFIFYIWFVGGLIVVANTSDIGTALAWPLIVAIKAAKAIRNSVRAA